MNLPELPEATYSDEPSGKWLWTASEMTAYGKQCAIEALEAIAKAVSKQTKIDHFDWAELKKEIRALKDSL